jgi:hypothetical protein
MSKTDKGLQEMVLKLARREAEARQLFNEFLREQRIETALLREDDYGMWMFDNWTPRVEKWLKGKAK